ncbi:protein shortage in chiasmata 1 ortholog [Genypterus blacodes]|uniref:protein shortage in chiasmata 1 ortholog n=1 Tax=Genypterus blacodes TaxID=154954 RepID=UPI003F760ADE
MLNLLALPEPYHLGNTDLYPHNGTLPEDTYRTPWIRGKVIPSCKLFISGSVLDDLRGYTQQLYSVERFSVTLSEMKGDLEVIPSSDPNSLDDTDQDQELFCLLNDSKTNDLCQETFCKMTAEELYSITQSDDLLLPEEIMLVDHMPGFKRHLPTLKAKLSRLRNLPVADPLLSSTGDSLSEDAIFRYLASYEASSDEYASVSQTSENIAEEFTKEPLKHEESFMLPVVLDTLTLNQDNCSTFQSSWGLMNLSPELLDERLPVLAELHKASLSPALVAEEISQYDVPKDSITDKMNGGPIDSQLAGRLLLPTDMELDLILTPNPETNQTEHCVSTTDLQLDHMSPLCRLWLVSEKRQKEMNVALWKAEKHPDCILHLLLTEPEMYESAVDLQPLSEALKLITIEVESLISDDESLQSSVGTGVPPALLGSCCELIESLSSDIPPTKETNVEEFTKVSPEHLQLNEVTILKNPSHQTPSPQLRKSGNTASHVQKEATNDSSQNTADSITTNYENEKSGTSIFSEPATSVKTGDERAGKMFSVSALTSSARMESICHNDRDQSEHQPEQSAPNPEQAVSSSLSVRDDHMSVLVTRHPPGRNLDPLSSFMMLRSQQTAAIPGAAESCVSIPALKLNQLITPGKPQQIQREDKRTAHSSAAVIGHATRGHKAEDQSTSQRVTHPITQPLPLHRLSSRVVQVQATDSQQRAYCEILAFIHPRMCSAREQGLNSPVWGDFSHLEPDQSHFLLKQQEKELSRVQAKSAELVRDQDQLFSLVALIHVLVTVKDLLLKCDLSTAVAYLIQAAEACVGQSLEQLVKRLQIILYLSQRNNESNLKLLQLQEQLAGWIQSRRGQNTTGKILIITTVSSKDSRSIIKGLSQVTGTAVTAVSPDEVTTKVKLATVLTGVRDSVCVVVCDQHIGGDFPWQCFSLVVEYDCRGQSPWASVCREKNISHLAFHTVLPNTEEEKASWCLEDNVPYVLLVTDGLLNCPLLLQTLESAFNITVLERSHCPSLQRLGGTHNYPVITVDESTAIIIQKQDELCQEQASERVVMRLTALSLQYSCCWLILHCPDSLREGAGFSSEAFNNLMLVYSSLVLFGMKAEDLDVKVLIVSEVLEIPKWISRICFHRLMACGREPWSFLDRGWLTVMPSQDENFLLQFPCMNPLVSQLMLRRAPSFQWLLGASLFQLKELLPEVPQKVLKFFSECTSLYTLIKHASTPESQSSDQRPNSSYVTDEPEQMHSDPKPEQFRADISDSQVGRVIESFREQDVGPAVQDGNKDFRVELSSFSSPDQHLQRRWASNDPWEEEKARERVKFPDWSSRAGAVGRVVERESNEWIQGAPTNCNTYAKYLHTTSNSPFKLDSTLGYSCRVQEPQEANAYSGLQLAGSSLTQDLLSSQGPADNDTASSSGGTTRFSARYGTKCWLGQERKRSGEVASLVGTALTPQKKRKLSYERVPGRSDGQTRLRLF